MPRKHTCPANIHAPHTYMPCTHTCPANIHKRTHVIRISTSYYLCPWSMCSYSMARWTIWVCHCWKFSKMNKLVFFSVNVVVGGLLRSSVCAWDLNLCWSTFSKVSCVAFWYARLLHNKFNLCVCMCDVNLSWEHIFKRIVLNCVVSWH